MISFPWCSFCWLYLLGFYKQYKVKNQPKHQFHHYDFQLLQFVYFCFLLATTEPPTTTPTKPPNPCKNVKCSSPPYSFCQADENNKPTCSCGFACLLYIRPVCGSDGQTYSNECIMRKTACAKNVMITIQSNGACCKYCIDLLVSLQKTYPSFIFTTCSMTEICLTNKQGIWKSARKIGKKCNFVSEKCDVCQKVRDRTLTLFQIPWIKLFSI